VALMFDPELLPALDVHDSRARIVMVSPLIRQMMIYALRWPIGRPDSDPLSDGFFQTLGHLVFEALDHEAPLSLPTAENPTVGAAMDYTKAHLSSLTAAEVSRRSQCPSERCDANSTRPSACRGGPICCTPGCCARWHCSSAPTSRCKRLPAPSVSRV